MKALIVFVLCLGLIGCVAKAKYDESQKQIESLNNLLKETTDGLSESNAKWAECRAHKYQLVPTGGRTWRFDTVTGQSCIQLTSDSDWKNKSTKKQSCNCVDFIETMSTVPAESRLESLRMYCGQIDYAALAKQSGATSSTPPTQPKAFDWNKYPKVK